VVGLSPLKSEITGVVDSQSMTAAYYWTFIIHNSTAVSQEAQLLMKLPPAATVSRATLWVNGKPEEAAFNSTARVENAYNWIVQRHRDPLLVTQIAPGQISIKAAPVLPGGDMQLRIGIVTAARLTSAERYQEAKAQFSLPYLLSSNLDQQIRQQVHLQSAERLTVKTASPRQTIDSDMSSSGGRQDYLVRGSLAQQDARSIVIQSDHPPLPGALFATRAMHSSSPAFIVANVEPSAAPACGLRLRETRERPACKFISSEDVAYRLSTLWAYGQAEQLAAHGQESQAGDLAHVFRFVSCVSGATVLEKESDYEFQHLDRERYQTLPLFAETDYVAPIPGHKPLAVSVVAEPDWKTTAETSVLPPYVLAGPLLAVPFGFARGALQQTLSQSFSTVVSQLNSLNSYSGGSAASGNQVLAFSDGSAVMAGQSASDVLIEKVVSVQDDERVRQLMTLSGPLGADAFNQIYKIVNRTDFGTDAWPSSEGTVQSLMGAVALLVAFTFVGPIALLLDALKIVLTRKQGALTCLRRSLVWLVVALCLPLLSQTLAVSFILCKAGQHLAEAVTLGKNLAVVRS
jgi:hypothetical protein